MRGDLFSVVRSNYDPMIIRRMNVDLVSASNLSASLLLVSITAFRPISVHRELESLMDLSERCVFVGKYFAG